MMMIMSRKFVQLLVFFFIVFLCLQISEGNGLLGDKTNVMCSKSERKSLLSFTQDQLYPFASWETEEDCCRWKEVGCNNETGRVISLDLHSSGLFNSSQGEFMQSLLGLPYLRYLDLSLNNFNHIQIPEVLGSLQNLEHLNLSNTNFMGLIPDQLGNLSRLQFLDLSGNNYSVKAESLDWVHGLSSLEVLVLDGVDLSMVAHWLYSINMLPSLLELRLSACRLMRLPQTLPYVNFTSLEILDLSQNNFNSSIPDWLFDVGRTLTDLNFSHNMLHGLIPEAFGNMTALTILDLSWNDLQGPIPATLDLKRGPSSLTELYLSNNQLNGSLGKSLAQFSELVILDISWNKLEGNLTETDLLNFTSLRLLDLSANLLGVNVSSSWTPHFQLEHLGLQSCQMLYGFPVWLRNQHNLMFVDVSNAGISDDVPEWFWTLSPNIEYMNLSRNSLSGLVPDLSSYLELSALDLSHNDFGSPLPHFPPNLKALVLSNGSFYGPITHICDMLSRNIPLSNLDLSHNNLSGLLPDCWTYGTNLVNLDLSYNNLSGPIPNSMGHLVHLISLDLSMNDLSGEVPISLKDCTRLVSLDLSSNRLVGKIPDWIGGRLQNLVLLILGYNAFHGDIPRQLCQLQSLRILDLSANHISGEIPRCVNNLIGMADPGSVSYYVYPDTVLRDYLKLIGRYSRHSQNLSIWYYLGAVDLSSNDLSGEVPSELTSLNRLVLLNLSNNHLVGTIPSGLGMLNQLEFLDLSKNQLSCSIPTSLADLSFLVFFNVSYNKLSGRIPAGTQFDSFDETSFMGNVNLCGFQMAKVCSRNDSYEDPKCKRVESRYTKESSHEDGDDDSELPFYIITAVGFLTGFWGFLVSFMLRRSGRHALYRFLDNTYDKIYIIVAIHIGRLRRFQIEQAPN